MNSTTTDINTPPDASPSDPTANWGLKEWTTVLHNAAQVPEGHPRYQEAQQFKDQALETINNLNQQANTADRIQAGQLAPGALGSTLAGVVGFGRGASLGLVKPPVVPGVGNVIGEAHPTASTVGDIVGTGATAAVLTPLTAGLSPWLAGATIAGGTGAVRGAIDPVLTGDRKIDALLGGLGGVVLGPVIGKGVSLAYQAVSTVGRNIARVLFNRAVVAAAQSGGKVAASEVVDATESLMRQYLGTNTKMSAQQIDDAVARSRPLWERSVPKPPLAAGMRPAEPVAPSSEVAPIPGSEGRGFSVSGTRATPPVPTHRTLAQMTGMSNLEHTPAPPAGPSTPNVAGTLRGLQNHLGRELSDEERDVVLQRVLRQRPGGGDRPLPPSLTRGTVADAGKQFPYYSRGGKASQLVEPVPQTSTPNPNFPSEYEKKLRQLQIFQPALESGDPNLIQWVQSLIGKIG